MKKRMTALLMCVLLVCLPILAQGASRGRETLYTFALDQAQTEAFKREAYFKGRWIQVTAPVNGPCDVRLQIYVDLDQDASTNDSRVYSRTFKNVSGTFTSPEIFLDFKKSATVPHRIDLYEGDTLTYSAYVYRMLLALNGNTVTTHGLRFRDVNSAITDKWMMFTPIDFADISPYNGTQVIDLVASNMYVVGKFTITRDGDRFMFTMEDIDTWNTHNDPEAFTPHEPYVDYNDPYYPLDAHHGIEFSSVRIELLGDLGQVGSVEHKDMDTFFKCGRWYSISSNLGGVTSWALYLNGRINYDPNGLSRMNAT